MVVAGYGCFLQEPYLCAQHTHVRTKYAQAVIHTAAMLCTLPWSRCTWDAMYSKVNAAAIQEGLKALVDGGAPPKLLIIDDGWQQTDVDPVFRHAAGAVGDV